MLKNRCAGILLSVTSLPSPHGIGDFGKEAYSFLDMIKKAGFSLWQILPLNPLGYGNSPYQPFSSYALDEQFIDLDDLVERGLLEEAPAFQADSTKVNYDEVRAYKLPLLRKAYEAEVKANPRCLVSFIRKNPWIKDYSVYRMIKRRHPSSWNEWPQQCQDWIKTRPSLSKKDRQDARFEIWLQMTAYRQWERLHKYANDLGIKIIGDIPFYVGFDSCDVWANQNMFLLDEETHLPTSVAGVPPDYFSATGQRWGNPIYDWDRLQKTGFAFLEQRIAKNAEIYDVIRLDHFRAFDTYWKIPSSCPTAIEGAWIEPPGYEFFDLFLSKHPNVEIIAEDLGDLRPEVLVLRDHYDFPGMNVVEFTFHDCEIAHKGDWNRVNSVVYIGTHDNDTLSSYYSLLPEYEQKQWDETLRNIGFAEGDIVDRVIDYTFHKPASWAILMVQDILHLGAEARTNVPGVVDNRNWTYKLASFAELEAKMDRLSSLIKKTGRK